MAKLAPMNMAPNVLSIAGILGKGIAPPGIGPCVGGIVGPARGGALGVPDIRTGEPKPA